MKENIQQNQCFYNIRLIALRKKRNNKSQSKKETKNNPVAQS